MSEKLEVDQEVTGTVNEDGEVVIQDKKWSAEKTSSSSETPPIPPSSEEEVRKTAAGTVVPPTAAKDDPEVIKTVEEFEKAAIAQIDDEEYWDDLMERGKLLKLIETPFQAPLGDDLFGSIRKNNIEQVEKLLTEGGEDPSQRNANGSYGMHFACIGNHLNIAKLLRKHGAAANVFNKAGLTPLHCSCDVSSSIKLCNWLVAEGADVNARSQTGKTPLHCCSLQGFADIAQWLLHKGARVNEETEDGTQPIHFACHSGNLSLLQLLVDHGALLGCVNKSGETPFMWACASGHLDIVLYMQQKWQELAAKGGDEDEVEGGGVDPFVSGIHGHNALHYATQGGHIDVVVQLIQMGLDVNSPDSEQGTPLHGACLKGFMPVVEYLVDTAGADINVKTSQGVSVLHRACDGGNVEVLEYLCDKGMVPSERDAEKRTPLHYAAYRGHIHIIEWILDNFENSELLLKSSNMRGSNCLHIACQKGQFKLAKYLVAHGVPINSQNNTGNTPFHFACENGHIKLAKWLSENGAKLWV